MLDVRRTKKLNMKYDVFISYKRRGASSATAAYLYELLRQKGYNVFFDRKEMRSGKFNEQLLEHISNATDIIILLEDGSLGAWFDNRPTKVNKASVNSDLSDSSDDDFGSQEEDPYKTDWFCMEIMHSLSLQGKNIVPILLNGYSMPEKKDLPPEMADLSLHNALSLDISEIEEFYEKYFVEQGYLKSKPVNLVLSKSFQSKGGVVGCFLFYTDVSSCDIYECGELIATLTDNEDEWHPFRYPVSFAGEHRFRVVNNDSCEIITINREISANCQQYVQVQFADSRNIWALTEEEIDAQEDPTVLHKWGLGLFEGTSKHDPDIVRSFKCLERAIGLGSKDALLFVSSHGSDLVALKKAPVEVALKWYRIAADNGNKEAQCNLGCAYRFGTGEKQDFGKALEWFTKAAGQGFAKAEFHLGYIYYKGLGVEKDCAKAAEWFMKAAEQGYPSAQNNLGLLYRRGEGVKKDHSKAIELFTKATEQGYVYAQYNLGIMYRYGFGVKKDFSKAVELFTKAAEQGYSNAQCELGVLLQYGKGADKDLKKAFEWYKKAAAQGNRVAQKYIGDLYYQSQGVEQDYHKAIEWYTKAAENNFTPAFNQLAWTYHMLSDYEKALHWAEKAVNASPNDPMVIDTLATVYEGLGRYDEALGKFEECLRLYEEKGNEEGKKRTAEKIQALKEKM